MITMMEMEIMDNKEVIPEISLEMGMIIMEMDQMISLTSLINFLIEIN